MLLPLLQRVDRIALRRHGFASVHVDTSAGRVHAMRRDGVGPQLVLVHGISSAGTEFRPVLERVARGWSGPILVPDLPAHGFSDVPDVGLDPDTLLAGLTESLDALVEPGALLFGNSLGGLAVIRYTLTAPDRVAGLLLCSPGGAGTEESAFQAFLDRFRMPTRAHAAAFVDRIHVRPPWYRRVIAGDIRRRFRAPHMTAFLDRLRAHHLLTPGEVGALAPPVLLVWGQSDHLMPREHLEWFRRHLPAHARVEEPEQLGHCPHLDTPGAIADRILGWASEFHSASDADLAGSDAATA